MIRKFQTFKKMPAYSERISFPCRDAETLEVRIAAKQNLTLRFSCIIILILMTIGGVAVVRYFLSGRAAEDLFGTLLWLACWFAVDFYFLYVLLWNIAGKEIIRFDGSALTVRYEIEGIGRTKMLPAKGISDISVGKAVGLNEFFGISGGTVKLIHDEEPHWFGIGISDEEAINIVKEISRLLKNSLLKQSMDGLPNSET